MLDVVLLVSLILLGLILALVTYLVHSIKRPDKGPSQEELEAAMRLSLSRSLDILKGSMTMSMKEAGLIEDVRSIRDVAASIAQSSQSLVRMFEVKRERSKFGEFQMEEILRDVLPPTKFSIREKINGVGTPDANIKSIHGLVCIDSKFPLENYRRMIEATHKREKKRFAKKFVEDVRAHIDKISGYIKPEKGTAEIAFGFIPSEAVYEYLVAEEQGLLLEGMKKGVYLTSPCTLVANLNLILTAIRATEITEKAEVIENNLNLLRTAFQEFEGEWNVLKGHISNAYGRMQGAHQKYDALRTKYDAITSQKMYGDRD